MNGAKACNIFLLASDAFTITNPASSTYGICGIIISGAASTFTTIQPINGHIFAYGTLGAVTITGPTTVNALTCPQTPVVCYAKGTLILSKNGFIPIENLKIGDKIITNGKIYNNKFILKDSKIQTKYLLWVSRFKVKNLNSNSRPVCIKKNAFGQNCPFKDLYVSPNHSLLLNGKMTIAKDIINGTTIYQDYECNDIEYYHLEFDSHSAICANGILAESYLESNNRYIFENVEKIRPNNNNNVKFKIMTFKR